MNFIFIIFYALLPSFFLCIYSFHSLNNSNKICKYYLKNKSQLLHIKMQVKDSNGLPIFSNIQPDLVDSSTTKLLNSLRRKFTSLEKKMEKEEKNFYELAIYETEKIQEPLNFYWGVLSHLLSVNNNQELREQHEKIMPKVIKLSNSISQSKKLYHCLEKSLEKQELTDIQKRIVQKELQSMKLNGVNLEDEDKKKFLKISQNLSKLSMKFRNNVLDSIKEYKMIIENDENMKEMPLSARELFSEKAKKEYPDSTPDNGPWIITLDGPSLISFMTYYPESEKRKELYKASISKASNGKYDNKNIIKKIIKLHQELAKLLGYDNYVDVSLSQKMASKDKIYELLNNISEASMKKGKNDLKELKKYAKVKNIELWDASYYLEKLKEKELGFKEEELKPYLQFENVLQGLFDLSKKIFNIEIKEVDIEKENIHVWHPDVKYFRIYDISNTEKEIASFYLDPFVRPGEKKGGAWMNECLGKSKIMGTKPVAYLILNGTPPLNGKPSLMTLGEMETLFHEFGHGLQHMLTTVDENEASGISNIEWDAVELPSQFMENWCYHEDTLMSFAKHYQTKEPMPQDLYHKILKQNKFHVANGINRQIYFSILDLHVYQNEFSNVYKVQKEIAQKYLVRKIDKDDRFLCSFEHIFAGGYSAGYYSYKWAEIMSLDAFGAFQEIIDSDESKEDKDKKLNELGLKFRNTVLSKGGGTDPLTVFKEFRGREPDSNAFMKHYGLI